MLSVISKLPSLPAQENDKVPLMHSSACLSPNTRQPGQEPLDCAFKAQGETMSRLGVGGGGGECINLSVAQGSKNLSKWSRLQEV